MISATGIKIDDRIIRQNSFAFTLIELILVMSILTAVMAISAPKLSFFVKRQAVKEQVNKFLALTYYASQEAISMGIPLTLWVDVRQNLIWLQPQVGFEPEYGSLYLNDKHYQYELDEAYTFEILPGNQTTNGLAFITFLPDGTIDQHSIQVLEFQAHNETYYLVFVAESQFWPSTHYLCNQKFCLLILLFVIFKMESDIDKYFLFLRQTSPLLTKTILLKLRFFL